MKAYAHWGIYSIQVAPAAFLTGRPIRAHLGMARICVFNAMTGPAGVAFRGNEPGVRPDGAAGPDAANDSLPKIARAQPSGDYAG